MLCLHCEFILESYPGSTLWLLPWPQIRHLLCTLHLRSGIMNTTSSVFANSVEHCPCVSDYPELYSFIQQTFIQQTFIEHPLYTVLGGWPEKWMRCSACPPGGSMLSVVKSTGCAESGKPGFHSLLWHLFVPWVFFLQLQNGDDINIYLKALL